VRLLAAEGDLVAFYGTYAGTQTGQWGTFPPSGKAFELELGGVVRISEGKIAELWITWDNLALLTQLGQVPPMPRSGTA
jgi:predicted ester cyclase